MLSADNDNLAKTLVRIHVLPAMTPVKRSVDIGSPRASQSASGFFIFLFFIFVFYKNIFSIWKFTGIYPGRPAAGRPAAGRQGHF